jgi:hypothetical protein
LIVSKFLIAVFGREPAEAKEGYLLSTGEEEGIWRYF